MADTQRTAQELADELEQYCDESDGSQYGTLSTKLVRGFVADLRAALASQAEPVAPTNDDAVGHIDEDGDVYIYDGAPRSVLLFAPPAPAQAEQSEDGRDAARWRALRELDGGEIYALLGDCDGIHPEQADAAIDAAMAKEKGND
jgi:hypothetical protein